jgi:hypothetical protein
MFRPVFYLSLRKLEYTQTSVYYFLTVYWLDNETLLSLGHGQHDVTRLAINLGFLALRRKEKNQISRGAPKL